MDRTAYKNLTMFSRQLLGIVGGYFLLSLRIW